MKRFLAPTLTAALAGITFAACSSGSSTAQTTGHSASKFSASSECQAYAKANPSAQVTTTADYVVVAGMGASEAMYTSEQATSMHPKSGEIMVSGQMDNGNNSMAMGSGTTMNHVEAHICSKGAGKVITGVMPTMSLQGTGPGVMATSIPVAEMQGLDRNPADTHYGNNVTITPGSRYHLIVTLNGQSGTVTMTAPGMSK
jgi:hypothetical protein